MRREQRYEDQGLLRNQNHKNTPLHSDSIMDVFWAIGISISDTGSQLSITERHLAHEPGLEKPHSERNHTAQEKDS